MGNIIDIDKHVFLRKIRDVALDEGMSKGIAIGESRGRLQGELQGKIPMLGEQLATKFAPLPEWARLQLKKASATQVERWGRKVLTADSLEGVLGKR
jgi:hypothetical protein